MKTHAGDRILVIDPHTAEILRAYLDTRDGWRLASGIVWPHTGLLSSAPTANPGTPTGLSDRFEHSSRGAGLPPIRFHDLRHCAASYLSSPART